MIGCCGIWEFPIDPGSNRSSDMAGTTDQAGGEVADVAHALQGLRPQELHNSKNPRAPGTNESKCERSMTVLTRYRQACHAETLRLT